MKIRLRGGAFTNRGGYHEWLPISQADNFKKLGFSFEEYMSLTPPTKRVKKSSNYI